MSFFARASWPGDHRDEFVAGALAAAVIVVLGYASGLGAPSERSAAAAPPRTEAPASPSAPSTPAPAETPAPGSGDEEAGNSGALPVGGIPADGSEGMGEAVGNHEHDNSGGIPQDSDHSGHAPPTPASPTPSAPPNNTPSPSPSSPTPSPSCTAGEVHLVQPLLKGVLTPVTGILDGLAKEGDGASAAPSGPASASGSDGEADTCVGLTSEPAVLTELTP
ncbi:hypothetical protein ABZY90_04695 [Streptomyces sp. NPDC006422]|uniref:hypothetical protein n=1 Tax=unclassified Streptomyces TaxID=2593676 RepID=UPI0033A1FB3A